MLLGKLQTPAIKVYQIDAFTTEQATAEYMVVNANEYVIGAETLKLELRFGNIVVENEDERFDVVTRQSMLLTQADIINWGTDDYVLLDIVADKLNNSIVSTVLKDFHYTF